MFNVFSNRITGISIPRFAQNNTESLYNAFKYLLNDKKIINFNALNDQTLFFNNGAFFEESSILIIDDGEKKIESGLVKTNNNEWQIKEDLAVLNKANITIYHKIFNTFSFDDENIVISHKNGSVKFWMDRHKFATIKKDAATFDCLLDYFATPAGGEFIFFASDDTFCMAQSGMGNRRLFLFSFCSDGVIGRTHAKSTMDGQLSGAYGITNGLSANSAAAFYQSIMPVTSPLLLQRWSPMGILTDGILNPCGTVPATVANSYTIHKSDKNYIYFLSYDNCIIPFLGGEI